MSICDETIVEGLIQVVAPQAEWLAVAHKTCGGWPASLGSESGAGYVSLQEGTTVLLVEACGTESDAEFPVLRIKTSLTGEGIDEGAELYVARNDSETYSTNTLHVEVYEFGEVGSLIRGNLTGAVDGGAGVEAVAVEGEFHVCHVADSPAP